MSKIKNVNWIVKDHPSQPFYKSKLNFEEIVKNLEKNYETIEKVLGLG